MALTYSVDDDCGEDCSRNFRAVLRVLVSADKLRMVALEEKTEH
jgi:hypothetical protein